MAIQFRAALAGDSAGAGSLTQVVTLPTGWQAGDFCVIGGRVGDSTSTFTTPSGWTVINAATYATGGYAYCFYYRVLQAGDTNPSFTYGFSSTWVWVSEAVRSDAGGTLSFDAQGAAVAQNGVAGSTFTPPAATAAGTGEASLIIAVGRNNVSVTATAWTDTPAAGWTKGADDAAVLNSTNAVRMGAAYYQLDVSGTVTPGVFTFTLTGPATTMLFTAQQVLVAETLPANSSMAAQSRQHAGRRKGRRHGAQRQQVQAAFGVLETVQPAVLPVILTAPTTATQDGAHW